MRVVAGLIEPVMPNTSPRILKDAGASAAVVSINFSMNGWRVRGRARAR